MKTATSLLITILASVLALTGGACTGGGITGPTGTGGTAGHGEAIYLPSSPDGFVSDPPSGVLGPWFSYSDADSDCVNKGGFPPADCSQVATPTPGQPFTPTDAATSEMCTSGIAAVVMNKDGRPDYTDLWGAGIELQFNSPGGDAGTVGYFDLSRYRGISFDFSGATVPPKSMRVNFPFKTMHGTDSPYWGGGGDTATLYSALAPPSGGTQHVEITWADVGGPAYLLTQSPSVTPPPFDPTAVQAIQFAVFTNPTAPIPYAFCVANLALLPK